MAGPGLATQQLTLVILAGGHSRRMGEDKPGLLFPGPGGLPLIRRLRERLGVIAGVPLIAGPHDYGTGWPVVADDPRLEGPAAGVVAGLGAAPGELALVLAADLPFPSPALALGLAELAGRHPELEAVVPVHRGRLEPLFAIYRRSASAALLRVGHSGASGARGPALRELLPQLRLLPVAEATWREWDPEALSFINCNTREELAEAAQREVGPRTKGGTP
ncbi:MAG: molybdenum cofactor guanylyltransferase [Candidatus Dormibacteria bacterium]